jgi:hypothetical protein
MSDNDQDIQLAEMIKMLRTELQIAQADGEGGPIALGVEKIELELKVALGSKKVGEAGVKFWVLKAGGKMEKHAEAIHTFRLTLSATSPATGNRLKVAHKTDGPVSRR